MNNSRVIPWPLVAQSFSRGRTPAKFLSPIEQKGAAFLLVQLNVGGTQRSWPQTRNCSQRCNWLTLFPVPVLHEDLEEPLDDEEEVDPGPDDQGDLQVAVVWVEVHVAQGEGGWDEVKDG